MPGERDCQERWRFIEPYVPREGAVLDIGSNLGYYAIKSALHSPGVFVVSVEADERIALAQRNILHSQELNRVCLVHGRFSRDVSRRVANVCDWFELTLLLSILHWMDDPGDVVSQLARVSAKMIVELPDAEDTGACGQEVLKLWRDPEGWLRAATSRHVIPIGRVRRHTSEVESHLLLVDGPVQRTPKLAYWGSTFEHPAGNDYLFSYDGRELSVRIRGKHVHYIPGVNIKTLEGLGRLLWPPTRYWRRWAKKALKASSGHLDPLPHNMLWVGHGIQLIDAADLKGAIRDQQGAMRVFKKFVKNWKRPGPKEAASARKAAMALVEDLRSLVSLWTSIVARSIPPWLVEMIRRVKRGTLG